MTRKNKLEVEDLMKINEADFIDDDTAFEIFLKAKKVEGVQPATIDKYKQVRNTVLKSIAILNIDKPMYALNSEDIESMILLWQEKYRVATINGNIRVMKPFYKVMVKKKVVRKDPMKDIHALPEREIIKETLNDDEIKIIINYYKRKKTFTGYRNLVIFMLLLDTGIRVGELCRILITDVHKDHIMITITKNLEQRVVYPNKNVMNMISTYLTIRREMDNPYLFVTIDNNPIKVRTYQEILQDTAQACNLDKSVSPHMLRRTYAKNAVISGIDAFSLARLLGHSTLSVTQKYVQFWGSDLKEQAKKHRDFTKLI